MYLKSILILLFLESSSILAISPNDLDQIDLLIKDFIQQNGISGCSFALVDSENGIKVAGGYGHRNVEDNLPVENQTLFNIASVSKGFTALIIAKTFHEMGYPVEEAMDVPISFFLPNTSFLVFSDRARTESISFRDLLSHRTCVDADYTSVLSYEGYEGSLDYSYRNRYRLSSCQFRNNYQYSNPSYDLAAELISQIAKKSIYQMFNELFIQIGMTNSRVIQINDDFENMPQLARPYVRNPANGNLVRHDPALLGRLAVATGSAGVLTSADDMTKYLNLHLTLGKNSEGVQIIPQEVISSLYKNSIPRHSRSTSGGVLDLGYGYGLGFFLQNFDGIGRRYHSGYITPYQSMFTLIHELNFGLFTSFSGPGGLSSPYSLHSQIIQLLRGKNFEKISIKHISDDMKEIYPDEFSHFALESGKRTKFQSYEKTSKLTPKLSEFAGLFGNAILGNVVIEFRQGDPNGELYFKYGKWGTGYVRQVNGQNFLVDFDTDAIHFSWASGNEFEGFPIQFTDTNRLIFSGGGQQFVRNKTIDTFPDKIWDPESCT